MFNKGYFSYPMTNAGMTQICTTDFGSEQENEAAKKWCEKMTKCMEEETNEDEEAVPAEEEEEENDEVEATINKTPSIKGQEEEEEKQQPDETAEITQKISEYCEEYNIPECLPVTSYSVVDLDDKYTVVKIGSFNYLLTKKDNEWNVSIVSQEDDICDTGSGNLDLIEYCGS